MWHASVSIVGKVGSVDLFTDRQILRGLDIAVRLLSGVGGELMVFVTNPTGRAIHAQKPLMESEFHHLPEGWMDIPAIDDLGPIRRINLNEPLNF